MPVTETKAPGLGWALGGWEARVGALQSSLCSSGEHRAAVPAPAAPWEAAWGGGAVLGRCPRQWGMSGVSPCEAQRSSPVCAATGVSVLKHDDRW